MPTLSRCCGAAWQIQMHGLVYWWQIELRPQDRRFARKDITYCLYYISTATPWSITDFWLISWTSLNRYYFLQAVNCIQSLKLDLFLNVKSISYPFDRHICLYKAIFHHLPFSIVCFLQRNRYFQKIPSAEQNKSLIQSLVISFTWQTSCTVSCEDQARRQSAVNYCVPFRWEQDILTLFNILFDYFLYYIRSVTLEATKV